MNTPQTHVPEEMNWADYWDSLTDEFFIRRASAELQPAVVDVPHLTERAAQTVTRRAAASEPA